MEVFQTPIPGLCLRPAQPEDTKLLLDFIRELAVYEKMEDQVIATEEILHNTLFVKRAAEGLLGELDGAPVAFALFFHNFSSFEGKPGLYLEDIFVRPSHRGRGIGKAIFSYLMDLAVQRDCARMEWSCLNWNAPSLAFYKSLGAVPMQEWTVHRLTRSQLEQRVKEQKKGEPPQRENPNAI